MLNENSSILRFNGRKQRGIYHRGQSRLAYVALPGGPGTLDEISDVIALARLGIDGKSCVLYDLDGFYQPLKKVFEKMIDSGFAYQEDFRNVLISPISKRSERLSKKEGWRKNEKSIISDRYAKCMRWRKACGIF